VSYARRVVAEGAGAGVVTGLAAQLHRRGHEVIWIKPGVPVEAGVKRADWATVEID
jgi:hypothetical protein